ncbi:hypothetical protein VTJ49DRAFT_702 [Mycothermus thermophilus]|uniref:Uncharacterized protein n=1 Tax=Humicola insolens TaxID=85995 RepID=A0ABR3VEC8_HUMIN
MAAPSDLEKPSSPSSSSSSGPPSQTDLSISPPPLTKPDAPSTPNHEPPSDDDFTPPDGGPAAWSQVLAGILVNMMAWGLPTTFGVFQLYYRDTLRLPESQIAWIGSLQIFLAFALCTPSGRLADAGYIRSTVAGGGALVVLGTLATSFCRGDYGKIFLAQGLCTGLGLGVMFMPPLAVINSYFVTKRALALAISAMGTGLGSLVFPATIQYLIPRVGFAWAVRVAALEALVLTALAVGLLRPRLRPRKSGPLVEWDAFREMPYALYSVGAFLWFWGLYFGFFYINAYARNVIHFTTTDSVQLLLITNGMSIPSRPVAGYLADRHAGVLNLYIIHTVILGSLIYAWSGVTTRSGMYVFSVFFGLANGAAQGLFPGSLARLTKDPRKLGTRFGMVCTISGFASLAGPPTAGAIIDASGGGRYLWAQVWAGTVIVLAGVMFAWTRVAVTGWKVWVKI